MADETITDAEKGISLTQLGTIKNLFETGMEAFLNADDVTLADSAQNIAATLS